MKENKMGTMPIGKLLTNMALPMIASMLVQALYNIVDSVYISRVSESAVTALSLAFPVQNMTIAFGSGLAVGVNSLLSRSLGAKDKESADKAAGNGIALMFIVVILFILFGIFGSRPYFELQSSVTETVEGGSAYVSICCIFCLGCFFQILFERLLQSTGRTMYTMVTQSTGAILNIILDPIFIFGWLGLPKFGIAGAAIATVIGQSVAALMALYFNIKHNPDIDILFRHFKLNKRIVDQILVVGLPTVVMMAIGSIMNFGMNQILQGFSETATGVFGIYYKLQSFFFMPLFGMNGAVISIVAFNYGAGNVERMTKTIKSALCTAICIMIAGFLSFQLIPQVLLGIFNPSEEFLAIGIVALRIISIHFPVAAVCIILGSTFQALGNGIYSTIVSLCRQLVVLLPVAYLLSLTGNVNNVWWAFLVAELASLTVTIILFRKLYNKKIKPLKAAK